MTPVVELCHVGKTFAGVVAVNDLSLNISPGGIFGMLGPNGAGKTTTIRLMIGILVPDSGSVSVFGAPLNRDATRRVGYLPEERGLYRRMTVRDNLVFLGELAGLTARAACDRALALCRRLELERWFDRRVEELSKGMQQKVQFMAALLHDPEFIVMDEPFSGLDPVNAGALEEILLELKREGRTVLLSTHSMEHAERLCDSICLVSRGKVALAGGLREIKAGYGAQSIRLECDGDVSFLREDPMVETCRALTNSIELRLAPEADPQELLRKMLDRVRVRKFEIAEPSLEDIFIDIVRRGNDKQSKLS